MREFEQVIISRRGTEIHTTIIDSGVSGAKLVVFVHGFKAERTEGGRFISVGRALASKGVNSICLDFPGCGASTEDFINYCISSMIDDIDSCVNYMKNNYVIDTEHMGMVGYSMGGRMTCIYTAIHPEFKTIGLWAAASYNEFNGGNSFLGNNVEQMAAEAEKNGYANALNDFDQTILHLSDQFFKDMFNYKAYDSLMKFTGNVIICHGDSDPTVPVEVSIKAYQNLEHTADKKLLIVKNANHGFGLWDDHMEQSEELTSNTIRYFEEHL